jgi:hypothetical protein
MTGPAPSEPLRLLDIEHELAGPDAEAALARHDAVLAALDARLRAAIAAGLPPGDFARAEELRKANVIARKILRLAVRDAKSPSAQPPI